MGRIAGFVAATAVMAAIIPSPALHQFALPSAELGVALTGIHLVLTVRRLLQSRQEYYSGRL